MEQTTEKRTTKNEKGELIQCKSGELSLLKRKFHLPSDAFILVRIPTQKALKLRKWLDKHDKVEVATGDAGELWLLNQTKIEELHGKSPMTLLETYEVEKMAPVSVPIAQPPQ
jgi:predicted nucleotidyltransferase